jgi:hypothetical protein
VCVVQVVGLEFAELAKTEQRNVTFQGVFPYTLGSAASEPQSGSNADGPGTNNGFYALAVCGSLAVGAAAAGLAIWYRRKRTAALPTAEGQEMVATVVEVSAVPMAASAVPLPESLTPARTSVFGSAAGSSPYASIPMAVAVPNKGDSL